MFKKEFERRLFRLYNRLDDYFKVGPRDCYSSGILPALFSAASYLWCNSPFKKSNK